MVREEDGEGREKDGLEKALERAGSAILEEYVHQRKDALGLVSFPAQRTCVLAGSCWRSGRQNLMQSDALWRYVACSKLI